MGPSALGQAHVQPGDAAAAAAASPDAGRTVWRHSSHTSPTAISACDFTFGTAEPYGAETRRAFDPHGGGTASVDRRVGCEGGQPGRVADRVAVPVVVEEDVDVAYVSLASPADASYVSGTALGVTGGEPVF
jgi:hypothetical protein